MAKNKTVFDVLSATDSVRFVFSSTFKHVDDVCDQSTRFLELNLPGVKKQLFAINLVIREGLTNAVRHGNGSDPDKMVRFLMQIENKKYLKLVIEDEGCGFDWRKQKKAVIKDNEDHGRGFAIMKAYFDNCRFNEKGNILYLEKDMSSC